MAHGVGGGLLYFIDEASELANVWDIEFSPTGDINADDAGLVGIDHIAQTMAYSEMLTWILFYRSMLGLEPDESLDVPDPNGLVRSQVMKSASGGIRLALNVLPTLPLPVTTGTAVFCGGCLPGGVPALAPVANRSASMGRART